MVPVQKLLACQTYAQISKTIPEFLALVTRICTSKLLASYLSAMQVKYSTDTYLCGSTSFDRTQVL
jgi:hypothetical protein